MSDMREILKSLMRAAGHSPRDLHAICGVTPSTTHRFLDGTHRDPSARTVRKWAQVYNVTESQLRGFEPLDHMPVLPLAEARELSELLTLEQYNHLENLKAIPREARHYIQSLTALIASMPRERRKVDVPIHPGKRAGEAHHESMARSESTDKEDDEEPKMQRRHIIDFR